MATATHTPELTGAAIPLSKPFGKTVRIEIKRQAGPDEKPYWDKFDLQRRTGMNVISALMEIATDPVTMDGRETTAIAYDANCLEEVCGSCAMRINGRARMACSALIENVIEDGVVRVEPLSKMPVVRDLSVDRSVIFENLKRVQAWVPVDGSYDLGPGPRITPAEQEEAYPISRCISCTICMEVCPQFNEDTGFVGAATIAQVKLFNQHPTGKALKTDRLHALMGDGGIQECSYSQNCVSSCPKEIPLTKAISDVNRDVMVQAVKDVFTR